MSKNSAAAAARRGGFREMVAFDIETLSKEPFPNAVTAAAVYGGPSALNKYFVFKTSVRDDPEANADADAAAREEFLSILDDAKSLCSFNGIQFDMRFMKVAWNLTDDRIRSWVLKTFDIFEASRLALGRFFSLSKVLEKNSLEGKTGSGADAIILAREHEWEKLGAYCLQDTKVTYLLSTQHVTMLPLVNQKNQIIGINRYMERLFVFH